ncbi:MAG: hypothetical protein RL062_1487, partial [Bacteroidota bacterium]
GCVAGMTGIGGGIYLSPILYLCRWNQPKMIATLCAYLILLNSLLSLIIIIYSLQKPIEIHWEWPLLALLGGILGSRLGIQILNQKQIKTVTALILVIVGAQLFLKQIV